MKISIIVPVYGVEKYIAKCINSIKRQTLSDFECLIIDDESKDNSIQVAKKTIGDDKRFKIYHKKNGGLSDARNFGIEKANGEYVLFVDSDDYIGETLLEDTYKKAKQNKCDIVCFDMMYVYENGEEKLSSCGEYELTNYQQTPELLFINNSANNKLFKRDFILDKRFVKGMWYEDLASIPVWLAKAKSVGFIKKPLYFYMQRAGSISHSADIRIFDIYKAISKIKNELSLSSTDVSDLYYNNCLVMTTLRIRDIADKKTRKKFYRKNIELLNREYPNWFQNLSKKNYSFKQMIVFKLLRYKMINLLDLIY